VVVPLLEFLLDKLDKIKVIFTKIAVAAVPEDQVVLLVLEKMDTAAKVTPTGKPALWDWVI
jgi:hypothetical protein